MKKWLFTFVYCVVISGSCLHAITPKTPLDITNRLFNVKDFGAIGDSLAMNTKPVQAAIDACSSSGGGTVWVPAGNFIIGTIQLKSNVTLSLDYGASLLGSQNIKDYATNITKPREGNVECLIFAENATNITIEGLGVIDGRGTHIAFPRGPARGKRNPRPRLIRMENCNQLNFVGVTFRRPAFWGIHLIDCKNVHFNGITVQFRNNNYNNDGLDLDGCQNVRIENCDIDAGDDGICLKSSLNPCRNFTIQNCRVSSNTAALKFGSSSQGGFIDINMRNCYFYNCPMGGIKLQLVDGGQLENITISRIVMEDVGNPIFLRLGNRAHRFNKDGNNEIATVGTLKNVHISDVVAKVTAESPEDEAKAVYKKRDLTKQNQNPDELAKKQKTRTGPIMITGIPGHHIENVTLENIEISFPGGGTEQDRANQVSEDEKRYPEQFYFGVLPAWGAYVRHAKNIEFKNVKLTTRSEDKREMIILDDVEGFVNQ
ncbi:glycoside hydrolase family 28 protein [Tamlana agarivorans]|uniref:Glycoside hydrolase family 28 protein n=1 Tax=Pseudotamlana agarivorans TaxID=481183 RepID=A0ACC5U9D5_9FLAO|nr:glycoside hydrolase family 28 protein [Tamlana agarivorans]MBU2950939.1 glycoside hydrolase family 28 protein [Tamlana agarivorans]